MMLSTSSVVALILGSAASVSAVLTTVGYGQCVEQTTLPPVTKTQAAYTQTITEPATLTTVRHSSLLYLLSCIQEMS